MAAQMRTNNFTRDALALARVYNSFDKLVWGWRAPWAVNVKATRQSNQPYKRERPCRWEKAIVKGTTARANATPRNSRTADS